MTDPIYVVVADAPPPPIVVAVATPGPPGPPGSSAYTTTTADFDQPGIGHSMTITVQSTVWMPMGSPLFIEVGGTYQITGIPDATHVTVQNLGAVGNAAQGVIIPAGSKLALGGGAYIGVNLATVVGLIEALA